MNRDFTLDRVPPPVPVATREILGGGGLKLHAREWGNPEGFPLLFIHGWSQSDLCWLNQVRGELADTARMVTFDLRGHGLSDKPPGPEHYADGQLWADDLASVIDQTGLDLPVLVSWSYGGYVVADYLRAYGDAHISGINLVGSATILRPPAFDHIGPGLLENARDMCVPDLFANTAATRRFLRACTSRPLGDHELAAALAWNMVVPPAIRGALLSRELDGSDVLARTSVPVLVSHGRDDMIVLPSMAESTFTACPAATLSWYDDVGHMPFWEAPDRFDRELADFASAARSSLPARPTPLWPLPRALTDGWRETGSTV
jgi:non-heme chloroperoxidase